MSCSCHAKMMRQNLSLQLNFGRHFYYPTYNIHTNVSRRRVGLTQRLDKILTMMPGCAWTILGITHCETLNTANAWWHLMLVRLIILGARHRHIAPIFVALYPFSLVCRVLESIREIYTCFWLGILNKLLSFLSNMTCILLRSHTNPEILIRLFQDQLF